MNEIIFIRNALLMSLNNSYTISFNAYGATGTMSNVVITSSTYTLPSSSYNRTGYNYNGWKVNNIGTLYVPGQSITVSSNITLYAQWTAIFYTITYYVDGTSWATDYCDYGNTLYLRSVTKSGYTFNGWATSNGGSVAYTAGQIITLTSNVSLFAAFTALPIHTVYFSFGGTLYDSLHIKPYVGVNPDIALLQCVAGDSIVLPKIYSTYTTAYYNCVWHIGNAYGTVIGSSGQTYTPNDNITLYVNGATVTI